MRMPLAGDDNMRVAEKPLAADALREWLKHVDGEVQGPAGQLGFEIGPPGPDRNDLDHRRDVLRSAGQLGQELGLQDVAEADIEHPLCRFELPGLEHAAGKGLQRLPHRSDQGAGERRRHHPMALAREQGFVEHRSEPAQGVAERRLGEHIARVRTSSPAAPRGAQYGRTTWISHFPPKRRITWSGSRPSWPSMSSRPSPNMAASSSGAICHGTILRSWRS